MRSNNHAGVVASGVLAIVIGSFVLYGVAIWAAASVITSGFKTATDRCGQHWKIEGVVGGDWFCPENPPSK